MPERTLGREAASSGAAGRIVRLIGGVALGAAVGVTPVLALEIVRLDAPAIGIARDSAAASLMPGSTKLTLGLDTLAAEYRAHRQALSSGAGPAGPFTSQRTMSTILGQSVVIDAIAADDPEVLKSTLEALGAEVTAVVGRVVSARLPLDQLGALEGDSALKFARPALAVTRTGSVTSQGDEAQRSDLARADFSVDGTGSRVGVLSDSFDCLGGYAADLLSGDLPAGVDVLSDLTAGCTDEGRAMAQIVHDVAPGTGLAFHTAWNGEADFAQGILDLAAAGSTIIVDDVIYFAEPMFQDGVIAQAVDAVKAMGIPYFSAAGNNGREAYEAAFVGSGQTGPGGGELHDFDPGPGVDTRLTIQQNAATNYIMQWQDPFLSVSGAPGAATDLAICFYFPVGAPSPLACTTTANAGGDPVDGLTLDGAGTLEIAVERRSGPGPNAVKLVGFSDIAFGESYAGTKAGTLYGHANGAGANAVGASAFFLTPTFGIDPPLLNDYSSAGNTAILFDAAGNPVSEIRAKPEFTAPDGGNNTFFGGDTASDADTLPNFFGTSAAAPHAAGVAALMREVSPGLTPARVTRLLQVTAVDILASSSGAVLGTGFDNDSGAGLIHAQDALAAIGPDLIGVWRPSTRKFLLDSNGNNTWDGTAGGDTQTAAFGLGTDRPLAGRW